MFIFLQKNKHFYFLPSLAHFIFLALLISLSCLLGKQFLYDGDTGYHIRAGEYILKTFSIPKHDIFSFTSPPLPWTAHEWLSEVLMALVHKGFGLTGIVVFFSLLLSLVYSFLFIVIKKENVNIYIALLITLWVIISSALHFLARPHIFGLLLFALWYKIIDDFEFKQKNYLYLLPFIMLLWVNLHGSFTIGLILIAIYLGANGIRFLMRRGSEREVFRKKTIWLCVIFVLCLAASLINPYGYHILLFPFKLIKEKFLMDHVGEFHSPNFHAPYSVPFRYLLLFLILILSFSKARLSLVEALLLIVFTNMALYYVRFITLFCIVIAPVMARQIELILQERKGKLVDFLQKKSKNIASIDASAKGVLWPTLAIIFMLFLVLTHKIEYSFDPKKHPVEAVNFLNKVQISGNMFNNDEFGDYIIYSSYPHYRVFIDGRLDMYGEKRLKEYYKVTRFEPDWEDVINKYEITWIFFNADSVLSRFLLERNDWKLIYADKVANIFVRNIPQNRHLIEQYPDVKPVLIDKKD